MEGCAFGVLDDVIGPEGLGTISGFDGFEGLFVVGRGEGDVLGWVPVLGEDDVVEFSGEDVDRGDDDVTVWDRQIAAGHEVILDVDDEQGVGGLELHGDSMVVQRVRSAVVHRTMPTSQNRDMAHPAPGEDGAPDSAATALGFSCPGWCRF